MLRTSRFLRILVSPGLDAEMFAIDSQLSPFFKQNGRRPPLLALRQLAQFFAAILLATAMRFLATL